MTYSTRTRRRVLNIAGLLIPPFKPARLKSNERSIYQRGRDAVLFPGSNGILWNQFLNKKVQSKIKLNMLKYSLFGWPSFWSFTETWKTLGTLPNTTLKNPSYLVFGELKHKAWGSSRPLDLQSSIWPPVTSDLDPCSEHLAGDAVLIHQNPRNYNQALSI